MWIEIYRTTSSNNFGMLDSLNKGDVRAIQFQKYIIRRDFFCKTKSVLIEFVFCAQTSDKLHKWGSNTAWYIDFRVFLSIKCLNIDKIAFGMFNLIAISEICLFQLTLSRMGEATKGPLYQFFPCNFYKRRNYLLPLKRKTFWILVWPFCQHWYQISSPYLVSVPDY